MLNKKLLFAPAALLLFMLAATAPARADVIVVTLPEFNGPLVADGFPRPSLTVDTFTFTIPAGQQILSATIGGTFGNTQSPSSAGVDLQLDGLLVGQCVSENACTFGNGPTPWSFTFSPANLSILSDGAAVFTATQTSGVIIRLGVTTLTITTGAATAPVPEPTTMLLLGTGLAGVVGAARRRRKAARVE
jgi:hypothetical protein